MHSELSQILTSEAMDEITSFRASQVENSYDSEEDASDSEQQPSGTSNEPKVSSLQFLSNFGFKSATVFSIKKSGLSGRNHH